MNSVPSENIVKLRELTDKINKNETKDEYKVIVKKLKSIVEDGNSELEKTNSTQSKIKCYENMCKTIATLLTSVKFI
jgi:hypothetical protein